jgi:hypothetical protein
MFSDRETFCIPQISTVFDKKGVFQQPLAISPVIRQTCVVRKPLLSSTANKRTWVKVLAFLSSVEIGTLTAHLLASVHPDCEARGGKRRAFTLVLQKEIRTNETWRSFDKLKLNDRA